MTGISKRIIQGNERESLNKRNYRGTICPKRQEQKSQDQDLIFVQMQMMGDDEL